jgi:hypothetical protein
MPQLRNCGTAAFCKTPHRAFDRARRACGGGGAVGGSTVAEVFNIARFSAHYWCGGVARRDGKLLRMWIGVQILTSQAAPSSRFCISLSIHSSMQATQVTDFSGSAAARLLE